MYDYVSTYDIKRPRKGATYRVNGLGSTLFGLKIIIRFEEVGWYLLFCIIEGDYFVRLGVNYNLIK